MNNIERAARVIAQTTSYGEAPVDECDMVVAQALADAGLLAPDTDKITRVTIVNDEGRAMEEWGINDMRLDIQDEGRTLKVFYTKK